MIYGKENIKSYYFMVQKEQNTLINCYIFKLCLIYDYSISSFMYSFMGKFPIKIIIKH